jgi:hypothetical protein
MERKQLWGLAVSTWVLALWSGILSERASTGSLPDLISWGLAAGVLIVGGFGSIALHEGAHALTLQRNGGTVTSVRIGLGPVLGSARIRRVPVTLHAIPTSGETRYAGLLSSTTQRSFLRAGPRVHVVLAAATLTGWLTTHGVPQQLLIALTLHQGWLWISNVLPVRPKGDVLGSDGYQLRQLRKGVSVNAADQWAAVMRESDAGVQQPLLDAADHALTGDLSPAAAVTAQGMRYLAQSRAGDYRPVVEAARALALEIADRRDAAREVRFVASDALLTGTLLQRLEPDEAELTAARQEVERAPDNDNRAHAIATGLVVTGRAEEAIPLLRGIDLSRLPLVDRAAILGTLALALIALDRRAEAAVLAASLPPWSPYHRAVADALAPAA